MNRERRRRRDRNREETLVEENPNPEEVDQSGRIWNEGFYLAFHILLPLFIAGIIWGRKAIVARLILQLDRSWLAVISPTFSKREKLLKWIMKHVPYMEGGLPTLWKDGAQLCTLINSVVPGACSNPHRHWKQPPTHGQALAYKYLGVPPIFTDTDLNQRAFTSAVEKTLIDYMLAVQQAISKLSRDDEELTFCNHYVARGMGLVTGEQYRRTVVYVYPNVRPVGDLFINIRGPYGTHGSATLKADDLRRRQRGVVAKCEDSKCDIDVTIELEAERAKVMFLPKNTGVYEICLTTNGEHLAGSPYNINVEKNTSGIIEELTSIVTKEKVAKIRCDTVEVPEWFAKQSRSLLFKSASAVVNDEVNNNVNSFVAEDKQTIEDKQSKDVQQYEPDLLEGHTKEASSVSEQHTDVEAPDCGKGLSDVSTGNVKETPTHKRRLTKCKAITDDYDPETTPHLPNLVAEHQPLVRPPPNFRENFERRRDFWNRISTSPHSSTVSLNEPAKTTRPVVALGETRQCRSFDYIDRRRRSQRGEFGLLRDKYRSVDELSFPSLKERRRMFLRDADAEDRGASREERAVSTETKRTRNYFGSIHERIKLFDSGFVDDKSQCSSDASQDADRRELAEYGAVKRKIKERFEKAQRFFRTLEAKSGNQGHRIVRQPSAGLRRRSLDDDNDEFVVVKSAGSLSALGGPVRQHRVVGASKSCSNLDQVRERYDD